MRYIVGIDEGTTGCKACLFDETGRLVSLASREYKSYYPHPGWVEQDIEEITENVFSACKEAIDKSGIDPQQIVGVSHSNQGITMVLLDEEENPVRRRTIGWQDLRHVESLDAFRERVDTEEYWALSGMEYGTYNIPVLNWLQENEPGLWKKVRRICSHQDYFLRQYGADGYYIDEGSANFLSMARMTDCEWDPRLMEVYHLDRSMLPEIVHTPGRIVGQVSSPYIAQKTGLPLGCKVCLGGLDTNCCALGAGAKDAGTQVLIMGTAGVSILVSDRMEPDRENRRITVRSNPGLGNWQYYIMTNTGASAFRWFRDELCSMEIATGKLMGVDPYDIITRTAAQSSPGANGVLALTCFQGAHTRRKNENARGTFFGIGLGTKKADIAQAVLEGICFEMKEVLLMNEQLAGEIRHVRLCGGVAKSERWCQMFADVLDKPVELTSEAELGCLGAAICAGIGAGLFTDVHEAIDRCVHIDKVFYPNEKNGAVYRKVFARWSELYGIAVEEIYRSPLLTI